MDADEDPHVEGVGTAEEAVHHECQVDGKGQGCLKGWVNRAEDNGR